MSKREKTISEWIAQLEIQMQRAKESMECVRRFKDSNDIEHLKEDAEKIANICSDFIQVIDFMDANNI